MQSFLEWLHWIRLIAHRHPNGPAWIQGVGSLLAVMAAVWIFWRQGKARERERRDDNRIRQERDKQERLVRRDIEHKAATDRRHREMEKARIASKDRLLKTKALLIIVWPLIVQTRSRMAYVLLKLNRSTAQLPDPFDSDRFYVDYEVGVPKEWDKIEREIFVFGSQLAIAIHEMLAIIRQHDRDIESLQKRRQPIDYKMHVDFLRYAKSHADQALDLLEVGYEKTIGVKPKRAVFWARSAKAAASRAEMRRSNAQKETESASPPLT